MEELDISVSREPSDPEIQWNHVDGPLLRCSDGTLHWLTMHERMMLRFGFTSIEDLNSHYRTDLPQRGI